MILSFQESGLTLGALHEAMTDAFSDYIVPMSLSLDQFEIMLVSRGFDPSCTQVSVANGQIDAFWNVAVRGKAAYLITSGTRPVGRGKGLSKSLGIAAVKAVRKNGCESMTAEVICGNHAAQSLYEKLGFKTKRRLLCCKLRRKDIDPNAPTKSWGEVHPKLVALRQSTPSWQNSDETLDILRPDCAATEQAAIAYDCNTGIIYQAAGKISDLLPIMKCGNEVKFINIDANDTALCSELADVGAEIFLEQNDIHLNIKETTP